MSREITISTNDVGDEFITALEDVLAIRKFKRLQYKDSFLDDDMQFLKYQLINKMKRLDMQFLNNELKTDNKNKESAIDSLLDIVNYSLFLVAKIKRGDIK